ncbi:efflux RND transporter periplasmic adaptor subunit [Shewanella gelidimarina]|uniref:HlyD family secretion protein n=1 Tax=Shewanella gelidimarina TaxID=56813 RepID=UPI00200F239D|nr:biotin/lipoyl-binding protein [Shewanella gelidimarina]MCL1057703.1 efflux RND transporter periplasmic adaptor subunit [Shewanella gelidimarina]
METLILLSYISLCVVAFKVFKLPKNKWTLTTAGVIGLILMGWIFLYMAMYQPVSRMARVYSVTTPITSQVSGLVTEVYVEGNKPLIKDQALYQIDKTPFLATVNKLDAQLKQISAKISFIHTELKRYSDLEKYQYSSQEQVDRLRTQLIEAKEQKIGFQADLKQAQFNLDSTTVRAPTDGYVTQVALRPGMKSRTIPFKGNLSFVHAEDKQIFAAFKQTPARYIKPGYKAEITFATIPGHAFSATVVQVNDIFAQGAVMPSGNLIKPEQNAQAGRLLVKVELNQPELIADMPLPAGTDAHVAVYSPNWKAFSIVRKVILRMQSWQGWLFEG